MIYKVLVNGITISRIILTTFFVYLIITGGYGILLSSFLYLAICLTDLIDGKLARKYSACSSFGAVLDVLADLFFLMTVSIALTTAEVFPFWMLIVFTAKFLEFWFTSSIVRKDGRNKNHIFLFDKLGRKVVVLFFVLPYISVLLSAGLADNIALLLMNFICMPVAVGAFISSLLRIKACIGLKKLSTT